MEYWNKYADIFQIRTKSDNKWGWRNGRNEIAGFLSSADMLLRFGFPWDDNMLAITFISWYNLEPNTIIESDIAFNSKFDWTTNGISTNQNNNLVNFNYICLHELGHAWGLDHNFKEISIMNYMRPQYMVYERLYGDDIIAIRQAFPSNVIARTDLGVHLYYSSGIQEVSDADVTLKVSSGGNLTVNNYIIENVGTNTISSPTIEWYLTPNIHSFNDAISLGLTTYSSLSPNKQFTRTSVERTLKIPSNVQAGRYYLAANVRLEEDSVKENNYSWLNRPITVLPKFVGNLTYAPSNSEFEYLFMRDDKNNLYALLFSSYFGFLENLSKAVDGQTIAGDPVYYREDNGTEHIFVRDTNNHLREWWWTTDSGWHLEDLSIAVGGQTIASDPVYYNENGKQQIFAIDSEGKIRQWWWTIETGWQMFMM
ncbi:matrixin family metalloprotease [Candidatus Marithrix sp. Canyon 246]|uniref:matrixin family metalloprotease n=1 Tax=Candidatus Marithrix sp. Canyon 246 TaxID=1827136 RepID=UPI000849F357|nr:matrixin family metalloprotease [Candidatus Marithrix sp. Canyon 246]